MEKNVPEKVVIIKLAPVKLLPCSFLSTSLSQKQKQQQQHNPNLQKPLGKREIRNVQENSSFDKYQACETDNDLILDSHLDNPEILINSSNNYNNQQFFKRPISASSIVSTCSSITNIESFIITKKKSTNNSFEDLDNSENDLLDNHTNSDNSLFISNSIQSVVAHITNNNNNCQQKNNSVDFNNIDLHLNSIILNNISSSRKSDNSDDEIIESQVLDY